MKLFHVFLLMWPFGQVVTRDICGEFYKNKIRVNIGTSGTLFAKNIFYDNLQGNTLKCSVSFVSCSQCAIEITIRHFELWDGDRLEITEPIRKPILRKVFSPSNFTKYFVSVSKGLNLSFYYGRAYKHAFTLEYFAKYNTVRIEGIAPYSGYVESPFFPHYYPSDYNSKRELQCLSRGCRIRLDFSDFQLARNSILEVVDGESRKRIQFNSMAKNVRPPIMFSTGNRLDVWFFANRATGIGFKAVFTFMDDFTSNKSIKFLPRTECGGYVNDMGGVISMTGMAETGGKPVCYDCIWILRPAKAFAQYKTRLYLKIHSFSNMANNEGELIIRKGVTSEHKLLHRLNDSHTGFPFQSATVVDINIGVYISFKGCFREESQLRIIYTAFSYAHVTNEEYSQSHCYILTDFLCDNGRCVWNRLKCDGFDHCADSSDEANCDVIKDESSNFYFPRPDGFPYATFITAFAAIGLMLVSCSMVMAVLASCFSHYRSNGRFQAIDQTLAGERDDPPTYEEPPSYEEVLRGLKSTAVMTTEEDHSAESNAPLIASGAPVETVEMPVRRPKLNGIFTFYRRSYDLTADLSCVQMQSQTKSRSAECLLSNTHG